MTIHQNSKIFNQNENKKQIKPNKKLNKKNRLKKSKYSTRQKKKKKVFPKRRLTYINMYISNVQRIKKKHMNRTPSFPFQMRVAAAPSVMGASFRRPWPGLASRWACRPSRIGADENHSAKRLKSPLKMSARD